MFSSFGALHAIAARRGDGLRPELLALLRRSRVAIELEAKSSFPAGEIDGTAIAVQSTRPDRRAAASHD